MKDLYSPSFEILRSQKKKDLGLGFIPLVIGLTAILLIFFFHPRSWTIAYCLLCIFIALIIVVLDYYFWFYRYAGDRAKEAYFRRLHSGQTERKVTYLGEKRTYYSERLCFVSLRFLEGENEIELRMLEEVTNPFVEGKTYFISSVHHDLCSYQEAEE